VSFFTICYLFIGENFGDLFMIRAKKKAD